MNSEKMQCNQSKCIYNEKIDEMQNKISALTICDAVNKTNIQNIKGEIDTMNKELEKLWEKIECKFDKVTSANNKLV